MLQTFNNEIYQSFSKSKGGDWFTPSNSKKFMSCGEYTLARDLVELGIMEMKKESNKWQFRNLK